MTMQGTPQRVRLSLRRGLSALLLALLVLLPAGAMLLAVEPRPRVADTGPPDAAAAVRVRDLALRLQDMLDAGAMGPFTVSEAEMNAAMSSLRWLQPGVAGHAAGPGWIARAGDIRGSAVHAAGALGEHGDCPRSLRARAGGDATAHRSPSPARRRGHTGGAARARLPCRRRTRNVSDAVDHRRQNRPAARHRGVRGE